MIMPRILPRDPAFPGLAEALDPGRMASLFRDTLEGQDTRTHAALETCVPDYLRYKPGVSCLIGYSLYFSGNGSISRSTQRVYGRLFHAREGRGAYEKARRTHTASPAFGPPVAYLDEINMMVSFYPNDRCLRGLRFLLDPDKLKRIAQQNLSRLVREPWWIRGRRTTIDVLSYKPERHCVVRCELGVRNVQTGEKGTLRAIAKILPAEEGSYISRANWHIWTACNVTGKIPMIPEPLAFDHASGIFFQEEMGGLHPSPSGAPGDDWNAVLGRIGESVRSFHDLPVRGLRMHSAHSELEDLRSSIVQASLVLPEYARDLLDLLDLLSATISRVEQKKASPVHGDLHNGQILITSRGPVILDLDEMRAGDPLMDVANFTAHLSMFVREGACSRSHMRAAEEAFLEAYTAGDESALHQPSYGWYKRASLVRLALSCLKYLPFDWQDQMAFFLTEARRESGIGL